MPVISSPILHMQGGLKAVIWTDFIQTFVMFGGQLAILIMVRGLSKVIYTYEDLLIFNKLFCVLVKATVLSGGLFEVFSIGQKFSRINFGEYDPFKRFNNTDIRSK